jgi:hypothetical protein
LASSGRAIDQYAWKLRPVLIFAPREGDPDLFRQRTALTGREQGIAERDIVLIEVIGDSVRTVVGPRYSAPAETLRDTFDIDEGQFQLLLLGKDTGVKLRSDKPVPAENLFSLIDSMPMRMQEMRARA